MPKAILIEQNLIQDNSLITVNPRFSRCTIGTSTNGWTEEDCDYLCDGIADDVEINAAIQALPYTGGKIILLDGAYNITANININKSGTMLKGNGNSTILNRDYDSSDTFQGMITCNSNYITLDSFVVDGIKSIYTSKNNYGISVCSNYNTIHNIKSINNQSGGIILDQSSKYNIITNNYIEGNKYGILIQNSDYNILDSNKIINNNFVGIYGPLYIANENKNIITRSNILSNEDYNIGLYIKDSIFAENILFGGEASGIYIADVFDENDAVVHSQNNIVSGNIIHQSKICVECLGNSNLIIGNQIQPNITDNAKGILLTNLTNAKNTKYNNALKNSIIVESNAVGIEVINSSNANIGGNLIRTSADANSILLYGINNEYSFVTGNNIFGKYYIIQGGKGNYFFNNFIGEFFWGEEPTNIKNSKNGTGDITWWKNLNNWIINNSTAEERAACVGKAKRLFSSDGTKAAIMICIGADQDGPKTLTFQSRSAVTMNLSLVDWSCGDISGYFPYLDSFLSDTEMSNSMQVVKMRSVLTLNKNPTPHTVKAFTISAQEAGFDYDRGEYTQGYPNNGYSYFKDNNSRIRYESADNYGNGGTAYMQILASFFGKQRPTGEVADTTYGIGIQANGSEEIVHVLDPTATSVEWPGTCTFTLGIHT